MSRPGPVHHLAQAEPRRLLEAARALEPDAGEGIAVLLAAEGAPDLGTLVAALRTLPVPAFGGVFPGLVWAGQARHRGALLLRLPLVAPPRLIRAGEPETDAALDALVGELGSRTATAFVLVDGLSPRLEEMLWGLYRAFGHRVAYLGGGAGTLAMTRAPCVFTTAGTAQDALVLALVDAAGRIGVHHGWEPVGEPVLSTRVAGNRVQELNWQPAFEVYRAAVARHAGVPPRRDDFFTLAKAYPFGIYREGSEPVVRDPIAVEGSDIVCVGALPENALLQVLHGDPERLIDAARRAAEDGKVGADRLPFVVDCISRSIFLAARFDEELAAVQAALELPETAPLPGVLSMGEIASGGGECLEFFNKTVAVGCLDV
ncbi:MAG: hypothetical protein D6721_02305 [Gammaproteobacteria bacterium]|nr:MAG: hypothetical protein D6721_02305 [Gammaproteobacteria bacterium]